MEASRATVVGSADPNNLTYPLGGIAIDPVTREITGYNKERQDFIIGPNPAPGFAGYFCARFSEQPTEWGTASNADGVLHTGQSSLDGSQVSAYIRFDQVVRSVEVRIGVSFISVDQARRNLDAEIPDGTTLEDTSRRTREAWIEKLDRIRVRGATEEQLTTFYTAVFHTLQVRACTIPELCCVVNLPMQYPYEQSENGKYYSGYDDTVHVGESYTGYSIWVRSTQCLHARPLSSFLT